jgi:hypothetical protein
MSRSKDILIDELLKQDPDFTREDIEEVMNGTGKPIFDGVDAAIKRHAKEMLDELATNNPEVKKALDEIQPS